MEISFKEMKSQYLCANSRMAGQGSFGQASGLILFHVARQGMTYWRLGRFVLEISQDSTPNN